MTSKTNRENRDNENGHVNGVAEYLRLLNSRNCFLITREKKMKLVLKENTQYASITKQRTYHSG